MPDYDEHDPYGETQPAPEAPGAPDPFDAFRARRAEERAEQERSSVPQQGEPDPQAYAAAAYPALDPPLEPPPYEQYTQVAPPPPFGEPMPRAPRRRLRSAIVFGGVAVLVVGVGAGVWAVTDSGGSPAATSAGTPSVSAPASPGSKAGKAAKAATVKLTVTSVGADSFTGTTAHGVTVVVHITSATRFGTAARPFTRAQLVTGAEVVARVRKEADGTLVATVVAAPKPAASGEPSASASSSAGAA